MTTTYSSDQTWAFIKPNNPKCLYCEKRAQRNGSPESPYWECQEHGKINLSMLVNHLVSQTDARLIEELCLRNRELSERLAKVEKENERLKKERDLVEV